ncbi:MAG: hypothetical protein M3N16_02780 [Actinomycetota bacterium]|nr:hypothetical protein [Actinomycetota bacterium]
MIRTLRKEGPWRPPGPGVAYHAVVWDDETGDAEITEYGEDGRRIRRFAWIHWTPAPRVGPTAQIGEVVEYDSDGVEVRRSPVVRGDR